MFASKETLEAREEISAKEWAKAKASWRRISGGCLFLLGVAALFLAFAAGGLHQLGKLG